MIARELNPHPALLADYHRSRTAKDVLLAQVNALLPAEHQAPDDKHSGLADKLIDAETGEQMALQKLMMQHIGAHLGIPWGTMLMLYCHASEYLPAPWREKWGTCECILNETEDAQSPTDDAPPDAIEPEWRIQS